jgi:hypothetical protein
MPYKPTGRPTGRPKNRPSWHRVQAAKALLQQHAEDYVRIHKTAAVNAAKRGNSTPAEWALGHISAVDESGKDVRPIASGIDRQEVSQGSRGPTINIGWVQPASLPVSPIIDVKALPAHEED